MASFDCGVRWLNSTGMDGYGYCPCIDTYPGLPFMLDATGYCPMPVGLAWMAAAAIYFSFSRKRAI